MKKQNTHLRIGMRIGAIFLLAIPLLATQAVARPKGGGGGAVAGAGRGSGGGGGGGRSIGVSHAGAGIGARSIGGAHFSGRSSSRSAVRSTNVKLHTGSTGARFVGASHHTFATAGASGALSRPAGLARAHAAFGNRVITNAAFKSSFARPPIFFGRFHGSHWP